MADPATDHAMAEQLRDWLCEVLGDDCSSTIREATNVVDSLRDGIVLQFLLQKLRSATASIPPTVKHDRPSAMSAFQCRDRVSRCINAIHNEFGVRTELLFDDNDLCDGKNDRAVVLCLLSLSKVCGGRVVPAEAEAALTAVDSSTDDVPLPADDCSVTVCGGAVPCGDLPLETHVLLESNGSAADGEQPADSLAVKWAKTHTSTIATSGLNGTLAVLRSCGDVFPHVLSFVDHRSLLWMHLLRNSFWTPWAPADGAYRLVSAAASQLFPSLAPHTRPMTLMDHVRLMRNIVSAVGPLAHSPNYFIYCMHASTPFIVPLMSRYLVNNIIHYIWAAPAIFVHNAKRQICTTDQTPFDMAETSLQLQGCGGEQPCVVVERQRYSLWNRRFTRAALLAFDPPAMECSQFPSAVSFVTDAGTSSAASDPPFHLQLPPQWRWVTDEDNVAVPWRVARSHSTPSPSPVDADGWVYSTGFRIWHSMRDGLSLKDFVRERTWTRQMCLE